MYNWSSITSYPRNIIMAPNEETLHDEILLIEAVLKGYPSSMARNDALRAVERLKKEIPNG
jgi:hypothetical protein